MSNYQDILTDRAGNDVVYAFWRRKVSERLRDPKKRELLAPAVAPHPFGAKRPSMEQRFYEVFNQENVNLVDINATPILEIYENGLKTTEKEYEFDVLIFATGAHASLMTMDQLKDRNGQGLIATLADSRILIYVV